MMPGAATAATEPVGDGGKKRKVAPYEGKWRYEETVKAIAPHLADLCERKISGEDFWYLTAMAFADYATTRTEPAAPARKKMEKLVQLMQGVNAKLAEDMNVDLKKFASLIRKEFEVQKSTDPLAELLELGNPGGKSEE